MCKKVYIDTENHVSDERKKEKENVLYLKY